MDNTRSALAPNVPCVSHPRRLRATPRSLSTMFSIGRLASGPMKLTPSRIFTPAAHPWVLSTKAGRSPGALAITHLVGLDIIKNQVYEWRHRVPTVSSARVHQEVGLTGKFVLEELAEVPFPGLFELCQPLIDHLACYHRCGFYSHVLSGEVLSCISCMSSSSSSLMSSKASSRSLRAI